MKKLIRELCKREGNLSQVKVGDMRETMGHLMNILTERESRALVKEFLIAAEVHHKKNLKKGKASSKGFRFIVHRNKGE